MFNNIIEVIDFILDEQNLQIFYNDFPLDGEGVLIESSNHSILETLDGLSDLHYSHIKLFFRIPKKNMGYVVLDEKIKAMYQKIYNSQHNKYGSIIIDRIEPYTLSSFSTDKECYVVSLDFDTRYRKEFL